ncbi:hypothetical protein GCM10009661_18980 [Catellatospora chokoriensis]|uniref:Uncharacterized protein n=1 Tax=Catellatospora chokoriensis TaxID=310353 RepID=A0A8J3JZ00_9ACTN|nr:hypothetical protein Cch02nite_71400 [Catellatospora chokoriensis]
MAALMTGSTVVASAGSTVVASAGTTGSTLVMEASAFGAASATRGNMVVSSSSGSCARCLLIRVSGSY